MKQTSEHKDYQLHPIEGENYIHPSKDFPREVRNPSIIKQI